MMDILQSTLLLHKGFTHHGFSTGTNLGYNTGDSDEDVRGRFQMLQKQIDARFGLVQVRQVHGNLIIDASGTTQNRIDWIEPPTQEADALISTTGTEFVAVRTADCAPILIACPETRQVAAIHAGWKGLKQGVIRNTVKEFLKRGSRPIALLAAIGPCICATCYEVGEDVARCFPESVDPINGKPGKYALELALAAEVSLITAGLTSDNIDRQDICTACGNRNLFSYRKSGGQCGRQIAWICGAHTENTNSTS